MKSFALAIRLIDDVLLARSSQTTGSRETLDHIPGSALLGVVASRLYSGLEPHDAWTIFHSGAVRFGLGAPALVQDGRATLSVPAPLSLHYVKARGSKAAEQDGFGALENRIHPREVDGQLEQLRNVWLTNDGRWIRPRKREASRTAIAPDTGVAAEGQLFAYEALAAGQTFVASVEFDASVADSLVDKVVAALSGRVRLGRSRAAEYGRAQIEVSAGDPYASWRTDGWAAEVDTAVYCLSDVALAETAGGGVRQITPKSLGMTGGEIVWSRSFVRTRTIAPFNAAVRAFEPERVLIEKGSVFCVAGAVAEGAAIRRVGRFREAGCGLVWIDPSWLRTHRPLPFAPADRAMTAKSHETDSTIPDSLSVAARDLESLLRFRMDRLQSDQAHASWARKEVVALEGLYASAAAIAGDPRAVVGPTPAQWGRVLQAAQDVRDVASLREALVGENGICTRTDDRGERGDDQWSLPAADPAGGAAFISFTRWLQRVLERLPSGDLDPFRLLAREARSLAQKLSSAAGRAN